MKTRFRLLFFILMLILLIGSDRTTKVLAQKELTGRGVLSFFHDTIRLVYTENTGAFLSMGADWPRSVGYIVFIIIPVIFLLAFAVYIILKRYQLSLLTFFCYTLILAGGLGNIIDRVIHGMRVSDFLNFGIGNLRTGILNLADFYITTGISIIIILSFIPKKKLPEQVEPAS
jgi:signal peptidase II